MTKRAAKKTYKYKPGRWTSKLPAQTVGEELARIEAKYGELTTEATVAESKSPRALLHNDFEWDDKKCGVAHRLSQARNIINAIQVIIVDCPSPVRAFANVRLISVEEPEQVEQCYQNIETVLEDPELRRQVLRRVLNQLTTLRNEYRNLKELSAIWEAVDLASIPKR